MHFESDGNKFKLQSVRMYFLIYMENSLLFQSVELFWINQSLPNRMY